MLSTRLNEHKKDENSSLYKHSFLTDHIIDYCKPEILARDSNAFRLCVKESLKIQDYCAHKSLNEILVRLNYTCYIIFMVTFSMLYTFSLVTEEASSNL